MRSLRIALGAALFVVLLVSVLVISVRRRDERTAQVAATAPADIDLRALTWLAARQDAEGGFGSLRRTACVLATLCSGARSDESERIVALACRSILRRQRHNGAFVEDAGPDETALVLMALRGVRERYRPDSLEVLTIFLPPDPRLWACAATQTDEELSTIVERELDAQVAQSDEPLESVCLTLSTLYALRRRMEH